MKIAFVKDFLPLMRGAEKVLQTWCEIWPQADIYALFHVKGALSPTIERHRIHTSFLQNFPRIAKWYRNYLPFMPTAIEQFDLSGYDLVLSMSQCVAKGAIVPPGAFHICYCLTPMRYIWDMKDVYFPPTDPLPKRLAAEWLTGYLRRWDVASVPRVGRFVAISTTVAERIRRWYGRESDILFPPGDDVFYTPSNEPREDYYLVVSALVPYKRVEYAIEACRRLKRRLVVIGGGPQERWLRSLAGSETAFLGWASNETLRHHYRRCRALLFPGEEDFGIVMVEAQLCGTPVIALNRGGARDIVRDNETGVLFCEPSAEGLTWGITDFEKRSIDPRLCRQNGLRFAREEYKTRFRSYVERVLK